MSSTSFNSLADFIEHANATLRLQQDDQVFLAPHISRNKLYGAMSSYIPSDVNPDEVLLLIDDTVFGGAKEGLAMTNKAIYLKEAFEQPRLFLLKDINSIAHSNQLIGSSLHINGLKVTSMTQPNAKTLQVFAQLIDDYLRIKQQSQSRTNSSHSKNANNGTSQKHLDVLWACNILQVSELSINRDSIQLAYRLRVKEFHPDKYQNLPESVLQILNEKTQEVNRAKDILMSHCRA